jgi:hypothetical protein
LLASLLKDLGRQCVVVFNFLDCAKSSFEAQVSSEIDAACTALPNALADLIPTTQNLPFVKREGHAKLQFFI